MHVHTEAFEIDPKSFRAGILIEVYTDGTGRRAHAQAWEIQIAPDRLEVVPFRLREVAGPDAEWPTPAREKPILTTSPIRTRKEAENVLAVWAMRTFAEQAHSPGQRRKSAPLS
jgi:hypothetical protein